MTTVKEFKDLGVEFVAGDECNSPCGKNIIDKTCYKQFFIDKCSDSQVCGFAWRPIAALPDNPKFKYEKATMPFSKDELYKKVWRPLLDQSTVREFEDKPVFTQAMADKGELPPVGEKVLASVDGEFVECEFLKSRVNSSGMTVYAVMCSGFELLWTGDIKPADTRTPKQKAVDEMLSLKSVTRTMGDFCSELYDAGYRKC